jgi:hypothetical protein
MVKGAPPGRSGADLGSYLWFYQDIGCKTTWETINDGLRVELDCIVTWYDPSTWLICIRGPWIGAYYLIIVAIVTICLLAILAFFPCTCNCRRKRWCSTVSVCLTGQRPSWWCGAHCYGKQSIGVGSHRDPKLNQKQALAGPALKEATTNNPTDYYRYTATDLSLQTPLLQPGLGSVGMRRSSGIHRPQNETDKNLSKK